MGVYKQLFDTYSKYYDTSGEAFTTLKEQLSRQSDSQVIDRKNFLGHFTASTFVVSKSTYHVALVHHNFLGKYLQPGGHIDESDNSPLNAARRELQEETGINSAQLLYQYVDIHNKCVPFNIGVQYIPENPKKQEHAHYHYDLQYLFWSDDDLAITIDQRESSTFAWVAWDSFKEMDDFTDIAKKIEALATTPFITKV